MRVIIKWQNMFIGIIETNSYTVKELELMGFTVELA